jgi:hypothetical protein
MSVVHRSERLEAWAPQHNACFYCDGAVSPDRPAVEWVGHEPIILHADCAPKLGAHLIGDAREATLGGGEPHWTRRAIRAVRDALVAQEVRR